MAGGYYNRIYPRTIKNRRVRCAARKEVCYKITFVRNVLAELQNTEMKIVELLEKQDSPELRKLLQCVRDVIKTIDQPSRDNRN